MVIWKVGGKGVVTHRRVVRWGLKLPVKWLIIYGPLLIVKCWWLLHYDCVGNEDVVPPFGGVME